MCFRRALSFRTLYRLTRSASLLSRSSTRWLAQPYIVAAAFAVGILLVEALIIIIKLGRADAAAHEANVPVSEVHTLLRGGADARHERHAGDENAASSAAARSAASLSRARSRNDR